MKIPFLGSSQPPPTTESLRLLPLKDECQKKIKEVVGKMLVEIVLVAQYSGDPHNSQELMQLIIIDRKMRNILNNFNDTMHVYKAQFLELLQKIEDVELVFTQVIKLVDKRIRQRIQREDLLARLGSFERVLKYMQ